MAKPDIFIVAAEPSGDQLGADLALSLQKLKSGTELSAIGGSALERAGLKSLMDTDGLAILGFLEGVKALPFVRKKVREAARIILKADPACVVLIDSWGFMVRLAKSLKAHGYRGIVIKYIAPQVWATRPGRAKILARHVDHLLSTQPMDKPHFDAAGLPQTYVGNAVLDRDYTCGNAAKFRRGHGVEEDRPTIGFFFGSRPAEIERIAKAVIHAERKLRDALPDMQSVYVVSDQVRTMIKPLIEDPDAIIVSQQTLVDAMSVMDGAIAVSGTITTQLAAAGVPTVVLYALSPITYFAIKRLFKPRFISLVNMSWDQRAPDIQPPLMPEFVQEEIMTDRPAQALLDILNDPARAQTVRQALMEETRRMGAGQANASERAAKAVLSLIDQRFEIET